MDSVVVLCPPEVMIQISENSLIAHTSVIRIQMKLTSIRSGRVMWVIFFSQPAPSSSALSYMSVGSCCRPAVIISMT